MRNTISLIRVKNQKKVKALLNVIDIGNKGVMDTNIECLSCSKVEDLGYFQLSDMRYHDSNVVTERVSTTALQLCFI